VSLALVAFLLMLSGLVRMQPVSVLLLVLLQATGAAALTLWAGLARWWVPIQFFFLPALYAATNLHVAPGFYFLAFLFFLLLYWGSYRTQVPFYPSGRRAWENVTSLLPKIDGLHIVDVGSGFGGMVFHLAQVRPDCDVLGVELAPLPYFASRLLATLRHSKGRFLHGDYGRLDFADFDVVFAYLSPAAMPALWSKARAEMRPGTLLLSYEFAIPGVESQFTNKSSSDGPILHGWHM
jgi:SAM-dependent methyltransferase